MGSQQTEKGPTILVVEDEVVTRTLVCKGLEMLHCECVHEAKDGLSAQELLSEHSVDVVVTDLNMPGLNGLELMRWARQHCAGPTWIILSELEAFDVAVEAIQLGAFDFLSKPLQLEQLQVSVRNALNQRQLEAERELLHAQLQVSNLQLSKKVDQLTKICRVLEDQSETISQDLRRAERIQSALLPNLLPTIPGYCVNTLYRPGHQVGGDLYDVVSLDDDHVAIYIVDAAGHGVSAAMLSVLFKHRLVMTDTQTGEPCLPGKVLEAMNRALLADVVAPGMFATAAYCLLNTRKGELLVASAGHPPVGYCSADGRAEYIERTGPALGLAARATYDEKRLEFERGARLLLYTDGLVEGGRQGRSSRDHLSFALTRESGDGQRVLEGLLDSTLRKRPLEPRDDVTVILLQACDGASTFDNQGSRQEPEDSLAVSWTRGAVQYGETADGTYIRISGRGGWGHCDTFYEATFAAVDAGRSLTLDLSACEYLDSTFLGTIHEIVTRAKSAGTGIRIQGVLPPMRHLFEELSMETVLENTFEDCVPLPQDMGALPPSARDRGRDHLRALRAHEVLASLSERNRDQFLDVVESLRAEFVAQEKQQGGGV